MDKIENKNIIKLSIFLGISIFIILISTSINAKYIIQNEFYVANINIDRSRPEIELIDIKNTNIGFETYANETHTITIRLRITEKNVKEVYFDKEHIKVKIDSNYVDNENIKLDIIENSQYGEIYQVQLNKPKTNGILKIEILEGTYINSLDLGNELKEIDTNIIIDNVAPEVAFTENKVNHGNICISINFSEKVKDINSWKISEDKLKIENNFIGDIFYKFYVEDYAGNKAFIKSF